MTVGETKPSLGSAPRGDGFFAGLVMPEEDFPPFQFYTRPPNAGRPLTDARTPALIVSPEAAVETVLATHHGLDICESIMAAATINVVDVVGFGSVDHLPDHPVDGVLLPVDEDFQVAVVARLARQFPGEPAAFPSQLASDFVVGKLGAEDLNTRKGSGICHEK